MIEQLLFNSFIAFIMPNIGIHIWVRYILKKEGYSISFFDVDFSTFRNLKELSERDIRYKTLYWLFMTLTILPILIFISFAIYLFV
ncbi:hypothetical protein ACFLSE_09160 [Bacteroidota bacterium]